MDLPEPTYAVPGLVPAGLSMLVAKPKVGKSWFVLGLAASIARGDEFFGQHLEPGDVLYVTYEDSHRRLLDRLKQMLDGGPLPERLEIWVSPPDDFDALVQQINAWVEEVDNPRMVILDPMGRFLPQRKTGQSDYDAATKSLGQLQAIGLKHNVCLLVVHHAKKNVGESNDVFDLALGTIGINGVMDAMLVLERERDQQTAVLHVTGRDIEERTVDVAFDRERGRWLLREEDLLEALTPEQRSVVDAIAAGHRTPRTLITRLGKRRTNVMNLLKKLCDRGFLQKVATGEYDVSPAVRRCLAAPGDIGDSSDTPTASVDQDALHATTTRSDTPLTPPPPAVPLPPEFAAAHVAF